MRSRHPCPCVFAFSTNEGALLVVSVFSFGVTRRKEFIMDELSKRVSRVAVGWLVGWLAGWLAGCFHD
jgi:hypothetical protein